MGTVGLVGKLRTGKENLIKTTDALLFWGVYVYVGGVITDCAPATCQVEYSSLTTLSKTRWWTSLGEETAELDASPPAWRTRQGVSGQQAPRHRGPRRLPEREGRVPVLPGHGHGHLVISRVVGHGEAGRLPQSVSSTSVLFGKMKCLDSFRSSLPIPDTKLWARVVGWVLAPPFIVHY